jgi:hypothetical protein
MTMKKLTPYLFVALAILAFSSCKKVDLSEIETTFDLSGKQAISENLTEDANNILNEVAETAGLTGAREPLITNSTTTCAAVSISGGAFPKTITLDFGTTGCSSGNSPVIRRGIITIVLSDSLRRPGSTATMTLNNYYVNNYKKEGTITWTNTSTPGTRSWRRVVANGRITAPNGNIWQHISDKSIAQTEGLSTPRNLIDDAYTITGTASTTNPAGNSRTSTIIIPLHKRVICDHIDKGSIQIQAPNHSALLDFGNGTCDNIATISIHNNNPRNITLP